VAGVEEDQAEVVPEVERGEAGLGVEVEQSAVVTAPTVAFTCWPPAEGSA